jgi:hypothetical protein
MIYRNSVFSDGRLNSIVPRLMHRARILKFLSSLLWVGLAGLVLPSLAWADCQTSYNQAMGLLDTTTKQASHNEKPSPDAFSAEFKTLVTSLQTQKCMPQLMSLIQHIQSEQQKIPNASDTAGKATGLPITD